MLNEMRRIAEAATARLGKTCYGLVSAIDPVSHAVKVLVQPDNVESGWLPVAALAAGEISISRLPSLNEHVSLASIEGDAEHLVVLAGQYDTVVRPPVSPATGEPAQSGELLIRTGCGLPPALGQQSANAATAGASWWHIAPGAIYCGSGNATLTVAEGSITMTVGGCTMTLSASGLAVTSGDIRTDGDVRTAAHSLNGHVHSNGNGGGNTGGPIG